MSYSVTKDEDKTIITYKWSKGSKAIAGFVQMSLLIFLAYYILNSHRLMPEAIFWSSFVILLLTFVFYKKQLTINSDQTITFIKRFYFLNIQRVVGNLEDYNFKNKVNYHKNKIMDHDGGVETSLGNAKSYTSNLILINKNGKHRNINIYAVNSIVKGSSFKRTCEHLEKTFGIEILDYYKR